jgi:long-subunit fatty acid transport protein
MKILPATFFFLLVATAAFAQDQQVGARTKAMGGSYTAFEDDPVSVWLNPAGISTQPDAFAVSYQTYTTYEINLNAGVLTGNDPNVKSVMSWSDPALIPSYLGFVFHTGTPETPQAFGVCFTAPYELRFPMSSISDTDIPNATFEQVFYRFRAAYARDFRILPPGGEGFFPHVAVGIGVDIGITRLSFKELSPEVIPSAPLDLTETAVGIGGGAGVLVGLYDNTRTFKANLGLAYQSKIHYHFSASTLFTPQFDWPNQYQAGLTFYMLEGLPLRVTLDAQRIEWDRATRDSTLPDHHSFENVNNYSLGAEYAIKIPWLLPGVTLYPRAGVRRFDAPWQSTNKQELPGITDRRLIIDPHHSVYTIVAYGLGLAWSNDAGKIRSIDIAIETGGDSPNFAIGLTFEL